MTAVRFVAAGAGLPIVGGLTAVAFHHAGPAGSLVAFLLAVTVLFVLVVPRRPR